MNKKLIAGFIVLVASIAYGATTYTTNYNLAKPGDGDNNFGASVRGNFDTIDTQMKLNADGTTDHISDTVDAHDATAISTVVGSFACTSSTTVQAYLDCLDSVFDPGVSGVLLLAGAQTITGVKTFAASPLLPAAANGILNTDVNGAISANSFTSLSPLTTQGDIIFHDGSLAARLAVGGANEVLQSDGTDPVWGPIVDANIDVAADIERTKLLAGTADHVVINDGSGVFSSEAQLAISRGGTGASSAVASFDALSPTTTRGDIVTRDATNNVRLPVGGANTVLQSDGTDPVWGAVVDANVDASAAVARSKLASGTLDHVIINDGSGVLSSEAQLSPSRGGTGISSLGAGVATFLGTPSSANLAGAITDETGSGAAVFATSPTLVTPVASSPTVRGDLLLQNTVGSQPTLQLSEDPDNGTDKVTIQSPATLGADYTLTLPVDDGASSQVLSTDGSGILSWATVATTVTTTRGDMIRRGVASDERFSASTDNRVVRGDGTDAISGQIDDPDFFTTGAAASASNIGVMTTAAQSFAGLKKFHSGLIQVSSIVATNADATLTNTDPRHITFTGFTTTRTVALPQTTILAGEVFTLVTTGSGDMAVTASGGGAIETIRAGHITLVALQAAPSLAAHWRVVFLDESVALSTTFTPTTSGGSTATGSTPTGSVTIKARRWGSGNSKQVSVLSPAVTTTDPGSNAVAIVQTTAFPIRFASNGSIGMGGTYPVRDNAGGSNTVGLVTMGSDAKVYLYKNYSQSLFTDNAIAGVDTAVTGGGVSLTFFNDP